MPAEDYRIDVLFVAGFGPVVRDVDESAALYRDTLGLKLLWPLYKAATSCFGVPEWPSDVPAPNAWIEFDIADIGAATKSLKAKGYHLVVAARKEPWGQTVTRLLSPEGVLVGITLTPTFRR